MPKALEVLAVDYLRMLIFGPSGFGKTWFYSLAAFVPEFLPMEIADFDNGTITLKSSLEGLSPEAWDKIEINSYRNPANPGQAHRDLTDRIREINRKITLQENAPEMFVLDSLSFMGKDVLDGVASDDHQPYAKRDHYGPQMQHVEKTMQALTSLKCHVVVIGHEDVEKDELSGSKFRSIDVTGKLVNRLPRYFNEVYYLNVGTDEYGQPRRYIQTASDEFVHGPKTAFPKVLAGRETVGVEVWKKLAGAMNQAQTVVQNGGWK